MKACVLTQTNILTIEQRPMPSFGEGEVLLRSRACGICGSDLPRVFSGKVYHFPLVLGHEFAGEVADASDPALVGMRAAVFPVLPCRRCDMCRAGEYPLCSDYDYYGSRRDGGMEEYLAVGVWNLVPIPDNVSFEEAAMCEPSAVARHAILRADPKPGESLLIFGAGPIGIILGQWARSMGVERIMYSDIDARKLDFALSLGFSVWDGSETADIAVEGAGAPSALCGAIEAAKPFGRVVLMGNAFGDMTVPQATYSKILRKQLTLRGTWNSSYNERVNDWTQTVAAMGDGRLNLKPLITQRFPLDEARAAFDLAREKKEFSSKVMITLS